MATGTSRTVYYTPSGGSKTNVGSYHQSSTISIANAANCTITASAVLRTSSGSSVSTTGGTVSPTSTTLTNKNSVITWDINAVCTVLSSISAAKNYPFTGSISWTKAGTSQTAISYTGSTGSMSPGTSAVTKDIATKSATVAKTTSSQAISATISMNINTSGNYSGSGNSSVSLSGTVPALSNNSVTLVATPASGYSFLGWATSTTATSYVSTSTSYTVSDVTAGATYYGIFMQNIVVTATNGNATYDGAAHKAKISVNIAGATVEYGTSTSYGYSLIATNANTAYELSSISRTDVGNSSGLSGTTTVYYRVSKSGYVTAVTSSTTITISRASVGAKPTTSVSKTYTGSSQSNGYTTPTGVTKSGNDSGTAAGTYTATYTPDGNHKWSDNTYAAVSVTLTIGQRTVTWSAPTANSSTLTYDGTSKTLASVGSATTGGTMYYYVSDSSTAPTFSTSTWKTTIDTQINAKTWYIYYRCYVSDTTNNTGTNINTTYSISKAINKANNPISFLGWSWTYSFTTSEETTTIREATNAQGTVSYSLQSQKQGSTTVSYFSFDASTKVLTVAASTPVNTYTLVFRATATGNDNYNSGTEDATVTVTINQASSSFSLSRTSLSLTYPTAQNSIFSGTNCSINTVASSNTNIATVSKSGNTITVTPQAVGTATITVTGTAASTNYSAPADKTISVTVSRGTQTVNLSATSGTITYPATTITFTASTTGNGALSVSPTSGNSVANASISNGTVTVTKVGYGTTTITVTAAQTNQYDSASKTYSVTVKKADGTLTLTAKTGLVYTGSSQTLTTYSGNSGTVTYDTTYVNSGTNAGTYTVKATSAESTNYYAVTKQVNVTISAANQAPTVTAVANLKYTGSAQTLATLGGTHPGTMHYRLGTNGSWSTTMPTATNAGSYTVYWYADAVANSASSTTNYTKATNNYNAYSSSSSPSSTACSIGKATNPMAWPSGSTVTKGYANALSTTISAVSNAQGTVTYSLTSQVNSSNIAVTYFSFNTSTRVLSAAASTATLDTYTIKITAVAAGNDNYESKTLIHTATIPVVRTSVGVKPTTSVSKTYTGSEQTNGYTTPTGVTMSGNNKGTTVGTYTATYTPNYGYCWSDDTYDAVSVTLTIGNANLTVSAPNQSYTYNGSAQGSAITVTSVGSQTVTIKYGTTSGTYNLTSAPQITNVADSKTIYYQATAANHNTATGSYTLTINKRTVTPTAPTLTTGTLTYNGNPKTLANAGSCTAGGTMYYYVGTSSTAPTFSTSTYSTSISTKTDAGTYYIFWYCYVSDTANNNDTTSDNINVVKSLGSRVIGQADNPIAVTATQSISANYNVSNQDKSFTAATGAQGTVTYAIQSQKNSGGTTVTSFSIPTNTSATLRVAALTTAGTYTVVVRATAAGNSNYKSGYKDITITVTVTSYTVTMTKGTGISSVTYKLGTGSATTYSSAVTVPVGQTVTYGATASSGYTWWKWTGTHTSTTNAYSFTMSTSNVSDTANAMQQITTPSWKGTLTYNGNSQSATTTTLWNNYSTSTSTIGGTTSGTNATSYNATFTPVSGYCWTDGTTSAKTVSWSIGTKPITITGASASKTYDKTALTSNSASLTSGSLVSGHTATYSASGTITNVGSTNNVPSVVIKSGSTDVTSNYGITKVNGTLTVTEKEVTLTWGTVSWVYDKSTHSTTCTVGGIISGDTCTVTLTGNSVGANVGTATVTASSLSNSNYKLPSAKTITLSVTQREVTLTWGTISWTYDGNTHSTTCTAGNLVSGDTCTVTLTGNSVGANVGSTTVTASSLSNSNYKLPSANTKIISVTNATMAVTATAYNAQYDGNAHSASIKVSIAGATVEYGTSTSYGKSLTATNADTNYLMSEVAITNVSQSVQTVYYRVTKANYTTVTGTTTITISNNTGLTLTPTAYTGTYDGSAHSAQIKSNLASTTINYGTSTSYGKSVTVGTSNVSMSEVTRTENGVTTVYYKGSKTNYSDKTGTTTVTITPKFDNQSKSITYDPSNNQNVAITAAQGGTSFSYTKVSGSFTISGTNIVIPAETAVGSYSIVIRATDTTSGHSSVTKDATYTIVINKATMTVTGIAGGGNYTGSAYKASIKVNIAGTSVSYGTNTSYGYSLTATNANTAYEMSSVSRSALGTTTVYYKVTKANYNDVTGTVDIVVTDTGKPTPTITSTNNIAASQTVTLAATDNVGVTGYYWGTSSSGGTYTTVTSTTSWSTTATVDNSGTYYLFVKDAAGNSNSTSIVFYKTTFSVTNGTSSFSTVITKSGNSFTTPTITASAGYNSPGKWTYDTSSTVNTGASYTPAGNKTLTAVCTINSYTLTIDPNGGIWNGSSSITTSTNSYNSTETIAAPTRIGYRFIGWAEVGPGKLAKLTNTDPSFDSSAGGVSVYNNSGGGTVTHTLQNSSADTTIYGNREIQIYTSTGTTSPGLGGFVLNTSSAANKKYIHAFVAKLAAGYSLQHAENATGDGRVITWLTPTAGTGNYQLYAYEHDCGSSGTFSTFGHVYVVSGNKPLTWQLAYSGMFDITNGTSDTYTYGAGNGRITALWVPLIYVKQSNSWKEAIPQIKVNGVWKTPNAVYVKVNGVWKQLG